MCHHSAEWEFGRFEPKSTECWLQPGSWSLNRFLSVPPKEEGQGDRPPQNCQAHPSLLGNSAEELCLLLNKYATETPGFQRLQGRSTLTRNHYHCGHAKRMHWSTKPALAVPSSGCRLTVCIPGAGAALPAEPGPGCGKLRPHRCACGAGRPHWPLCLGRATRSLQLKSKRKFHYELLFQINLGPQTVPAAKTILD